MEMKTSVSITALCLGVMACSQILIACSRPQGNDRGEVSVQIPTGYSVSNSMFDPLPSLRLPIQGYIESDLLRQDTALAIVKLETKCLERKGIKYRPTVPKHFSSPSPMAGRYGPVNRAQALQGYHFMESFPSRAKSVRAAPPPKDVAAVTACVATARKMIPQGDDPELTDEIKDQAYFNASKLPVVTEAFSKWSACMADAGYAYSDPQAAMRDKRWNWKSSSPSRLEINVAMRDVFCKEKAGVVGAWFAGEAALEKKGIADNMAKLAPVYSGLRKQERKVAQIISDGAS